MIGKDLRVNGEFYVAPVHNELISRGKKAAVFNAGAEFDGMYGFGIPADVDKFARPGVAKKNLRKSPRQRAFGAVPPGRARG